MLISLIVAMSTENRVIGNDNDIPWNGKCPLDFKFFKLNTKGKSVVMGRKTHESIGGVLPDRRNIIMTRQKKYESPDCLVVSTLEDAVYSASHKFGSSELMVIGGQEIYRLFLPVAGKIYLTHIKEKFEGDTFFPQLNDLWKSTLKTPWFKNEKNIPHRFEILEKSR